ncbi:MAG: bifunctional (p)ppGpp synthetase/guanosine-3',5'-bis(diphosphate) 3'-pyrophosphohydrolase [Lactobacillus sp.]|jgi:GTP pyrophosphokinase|nr:bifunctional (p)ppGpp synthetase/guanosine-3',5'-bis(diphosphate) 3'-pyrophosphohydrolase [Lactobacillus sp.]
MSKYVEMTHEEVMAECKQYMTPDQQAFVEKAYQFAVKAHGDQKRASGQSYIIHPTQVAGTLAKLRLDADTVAAGFLHDTVEDTPVTNEDIEKNFGHDVAFIVDGVTKLSKYKYKSHEEFLAENHRKMLIAMAKDLRVIMVKLADRLHNMHTLDHLRPDKQRRIAAETLDIYAPLADRLGIGTIKWELEDMSLHYLNPQQYYRIVNLMQAKRSQREKYIADAIAVLKDELDTLGIKYEIYGRPKHIYSIYKKMRDKHKQFSEIYDLLAVRVIVQTVRDCYAVLGVVHTKWKPMPGRFKDYIAVPKVNGYQSLHTTIIGPGGRPLEIQIRTEHMHQVAEYGVAAHWAYKEGVHDAVEMTSAGKKLDMFREILELGEETNNADEFMQGVQSDIFSDRVYVFTPKGEVYELPKGSITIDFAYMIHSEVGAHSVGARVNGKIVPLDYQLKNGDVVEMLTQTNARPSADWVNMVKTSRARNKIKRFFRAEGRSENIAKGQSEVEEVLTQEDLLPKDYMDKDHVDKVLEHFNYHNADELYAAIGFGELSAQTVANRLTLDLRKQEEAAKEKARTDQIMNAGQQASDDNSDSGSQTESSQSDNGVKIQGVSDLMLRLAKCCNPVPGDPIVGYVTQGRGVTIHRADCHNLNGAAKTEGRLIDVDWEDDQGSSKQTYDADVEVFGYNRSKLLSDVISVLNSQTKNIDNISGKVDSNNMAHIYTTVAVRNAAHLDQIIGRLRDIPNVYEVKRADN